MGCRSTRWLLLLLMTGCVGPARPCIDGIVCDLAALPRDTQTRAAPVNTTLNADARESAALPEKLEIPDEIPGAQVPKLELPSADEKEQRTLALRTLYPVTPPLGATLQPLAGPDGKPLTLAQLQTMALSNHPALRQAVARVEAARGAALQAGFLPNPTIGFAGNTVGTANTAGQVGPYFDQTIPLGNKLQLNRAVAAMDLRQAEIAQRRAELDLLTSVRRGFFKVLVAQESVRTLQALEQLAERVHRVQVEQVIVGGEAAPYEPLQTRVQITQVRAALVQARHQVISAWKQLAAAVGLPGLPYTQLAGNLTDMPLPLYEYRSVLGHVVTKHTELLSAESAILRARHAVALARVANVPNLAVNVQITPDFTTPGNPITPTFTVGLNGLPVWHQNQGAIAQAEAELIAADEEMPRLRNTLTARVADAYERFVAYRAQIVYLRDGALPDQIRAYRALRDRYVRDPSIPDSSQPNFQDVINAQQNLGQLVGSYLGHLDSFTTALVDLADLIQTDDLYFLSTGRVCIGPLGLTLVEEARTCSPVPSGPYLAPAGDWRVQTPALNAPAEMPPVRKPAPKLPEPKPPELELPAPRGDTLPPIGQGPSTRR